MNRRGRCGCQKEKDFRKAGCNGRRAEREKINPWGKQSSDKADWEEGPVRKLDKWRKQGRKGRVGGECVPETGRAWQRTDEMKCVACSN